MWKITGHFKTTLPDTKAFFSMCVVTFTQKCTAQRKREVWPQKYFPYNVQNLQDKMQMRSMTKNPNNYESMRKETNIYEQKPTNIDEFNDLGEADLKERVEKRKKKRGERLLKIINFRKKNMKKIRLRRKKCGNEMLS